MIEGGLGPVLTDDVQSAWVDDVPPQLLPLQYGRADGLVMRGRHGSPVEVQLQLAMLGPELVLVILTRDDTYAPWRQLLIPWRNVRAVTL